MQSQGEDSSDISPVWGHMEADIVRFPAVTWVGETDISASDKFQGDLNKTRRHGQSVTMIFKMCKGRNEAIRETAGAQWIILVDVVNEAKCGGLAYKPGSGFPVHTKPKELEAQPSSTHTTQLAPSSVLCDKLQISVSLSETSLLVTVFSPFPKQVGLSQNLGKDSMQDACCSPTSQFPFSTQCLHAPLQLPKACCHQSVSTLQQPNSS